MCKRKMVTLGLDKPGDRRKLAKAINIGYTNMSMALSGYRKSNAYYNILTILHDHLKTL